MIWFILGAGAGFLIGAIGMAMMKTRITANSNVLFIGDDCRDRRTAINAGINYFHWNGFRDQISYNQCISQLSVLCYS